MQDAERPAPACSAFRRIRRSIAALLLALYLPGCYHYVPLQGMTPQEYIATKHPGRVRLTFADSSRTELLKPSVSGDSLVGFREGPPRGGFYTQGELISVLLSAVHGFEVHEHDDRATTAVVLAVLLVVGGGIAGTVGVAVAQLDD